MCTREMTLGEEIINLTKRGIDVPTVERMYRKYIDLDEKGKSEGCYAIDLGPLFPTFDIGDTVRYCRADVEATLNLFRDTVHNPYSTLPADIKVGDKMMVPLGKLGNFKEELEELLENVCKIAAELGIHINRKKTRIVKISSKYKFLQIKYTLTDTGKVIKRINPDRVTAMRRKLKKLAVKVENEEADYDNVENMFRGWMGGHYKLLSREQRKNLIQLYEDLFSKEITIVNKKLIVSDRSA